MRKINCTCTKEKQCKHCYDKNRRLKMKNGDWQFNLPMPNKLTLEQEQVLIGGLLGDFYLYQNKNHINAGIACGRSSKDKKYLNFEYLLFKDFCNDGVKEKDCFDKRTLKTYKGVWFRTRVTEVFTPYKRKWYPSGNKIIPKDLKLTPLICAIWFCDDGSIIRVSKTNCKLQLATDGFQKKEVEFLSSLLQKEIGGQFNVYPKEGNYVIVAFHDTALKFIKYIQSDFPKSMKRKSNKWKGLV
jgi:hypothetical protein